MECGWVFSSRSSPATFSCRNYLLQTFDSNRDVVNYCPTDAYREYYVSVLISSVSGKAFLRHAERFDMHFQVEKHEPCNLFIVPNMSR